MVDVALRKFCHKITDNLGNKQNFCQKFYEFRENLFIHQDNKHTPRQL